MLVGRASEVSVTSAFWCISRYAGDSLSRRPHVLSAFMSSDVWSGAEKSVVTVLVIRKLSIYRKSFRIISIVIPLHSSCRVVWPGRAVVVTGIVGKRRTFL